MLMSSAVKLCVASCRSWALSPTHVLWNAQPRVVLVTSTTRRLRGHGLAWHDLNSVLEPLRAWNHRWIREGGASDPMGTFGNTSRAPIRVWVTKFSQFRKLEQKYRPTHYPRINFLNRGLV